jgi:glycosyltransferase involved in cell wall biosynthesis
MTTLVAIPFYGRPDLLPKAVKSALRQTVKDIIVVVYADGEMPPKLPKDSRLRVHVSPVNRGPYFAFQAMLLASPHEYIAPVGADDWLEPDHLEQMMPAVERFTAVTTGRVFWHTPERGLLKIAKVARGYGYEVGLFRTDRLLGIGGWDPNERVGQDSLIVQLLPLTGGRRISGVPTYHRLRRPGSLSTSDETGNKSRYRDAVRERNRRVLQQCRKLARRPALGSVRDYRASLVPPEIKDALDAEVAVLRAIL